MMELVWPAAEHLASYVAALERGWSADNVRGALQLAKNSRRSMRTHISSSLRWSTAKQRVTQLPCRTDPLSRDSRGIAAGCGRGVLREHRLSLAAWYSRLAAHCLGHVGYAVVPWKQWRGYATLALRMLLLEARAVGLPFIEITTEPENIASQRVIQANGGVLFEHFTAPAQFGNRPSLRYRIAMQ